MAEEVNDIILALDETNAAATSLSGEPGVQPSSDDGVSDEPLELSTGPSISAVSTAEVPSSSSGASNSSADGASTSGTSDSTNKNGKVHKPEKKTVSFDSQISGESMRSRSREEPLDDESVLIASTLVEDAKEGRNLTFILTGKCVRSYILYNNKWLRWLLYLSIGLILALAIFEPPAVTDMELPYWLTYVDMICFIIWRNVATSGRPIRWSRCLRPLFIINFPDGKQIRRAFRNIRRTVPDILNVLILFLLSVLLFALLALKLFYRRDMVYPDGSPYFADYFDSIWDLYVLVTTANNPDVMMPAYNKNNWFAVFFIVYLVICLYIFMSIVLAAIYNNYRRNLKNEIKSAVFMKRQQLVKAFDLLKVVRHDVPVITHARWRQLTSVLLPTKSHVYADLMMKILDDDNTNVLSKKNFMNMADLMNVHLSEVKDRITLQEMLFPNFYNHRYSKKFKFVVRHRFFRYMFDLMIAVNALFIALDIDVADWFFLSVFLFEILCNLYVAGIKEYFTRFWFTFDFLVIGSALVASIVEKILGRSDEELRTLDVLLVLRVMRLVKIFGSVKRFKVILQTLLNIGTSIATYGGVIFVFFYTFAIIGMEVFGGLIHYYGYDPEAESGSETAFCGNPKLKDSFFYKDHYCGNNFNHIFKAMVLMFELMVVNHKAARLYFFIFHMCTVVIVLNIFTAFILEAFILEYTLQTVPKLESVVEAKIKELGLGIGMMPRKMSIKGPAGDSIDLVENAEPLATDAEAPVQTNQTAEAEDSDEEDELPDLSQEKGFKFHLKKRSRKKVEVLLMQMFQGELGDLEDVPENLEEVERYRRSRKPTLEEIA
ncbi:two pore calcium channel protein 1 [Elysia marginata]|uniref:Two pore calcium channel protein 1 n=1 Tax=Elysia marginata TaxID=1093978 RepID=A0AAV4F787_9GAST|nr:two pore calcium channel protein 1 [Elysia marginata]